MKPSERIDELTKAEELSANTWSGRRILALIAYLDERHEADQARGEVSRHVFLSRSDAGGFCANCGRAYHDHYTGPYAPEGVLYCSRYRVPRKPTDPSPPQAPSPDSTGEAIVVTNDEAAHWREVGMKTNRELVAMRGKYHLCRRENRRLNKAIRKANADAAASRRNSRDSSKRYWDNQAKLVEAEIERNALRTERDSLKAELERSREGGLRTVEALSVANIELAKRDAELANMTAELLDEAKRFAELSRQARKREAVVEAAKRYVHAIAERGYESAMGDGLRLEQALSALQAPAVEPAKLTGDARNWLCFHCGKSIRDCSDSTHHCCSACAHAYAHPEPAPVDPVIRVGSTRAADTARLAAALDAAAQPATEREVRVGQVWRNNGGHYGVTVLKLSTDEVFVKEGNGDLDQWVRENFTKYFTWVSDPASPTVEPEPGSDACYCSDYCSSGIPCPPGKCPNVPKRPLDGGEG